MSKKLALTEQTSYMLGIYAHSPQEPSASVAAESGSEAAIEKFSYIALNELGIEPNKILVSQDKDTYRALFYHSKIRKLFDRALERKTKLFKYENAHAAQYLAGTFDAVGGINTKGTYLAGIDAADSVILENLGLHTMQQGSKHYMNNAGKFIEFVKKYSAKLPSLL